MHALGSLLLNLVNICKLIVSMSEDLEDDFLEDDLNPSIFNNVLIQYEEIPARMLPSTTHHQIDTENLKTYIYPTNLQVRDYQYNIVNRALFHNVLVALPTGLGKTFIASTVMLNFLRWFPSLKIIFMAPTRPLVAQQIKACCGITGIPSSKVAILLDKSKRNRAAIWDEKQVFFTTPQVVENDLAAGIVDPKLVVLLVIDEAHRAKGNYAYNNVVKFLNRFNRSYRILALTATPASDVDGVQEIVDNLCISKVEVRTERSIDIFRYLKKKTVERINVEQSPEIIEIIELLCEAVQPVLQTANQRKIYEITDPARINAFAALDAQQKLVKNPTIPEGLKWANYFILQLLIVVGQCLRRINIHGIRSFYSYFHDKYTEFSTKYNKKMSTNHLAAKFYFHESTKKLLARCEKLIEDPSFLGHRKLEITISELENFFKYSANNDSRVIIFTEFRESALDIVRSLERENALSKPHIFIGQAKERGKFNEEKFLKKAKKSKKKASEAEGTPDPKFDRPLSSSELAQMNGMNQKMQKELIKKFKAGEYNVLVATSIGEEGLDIGEVDLIICYDSTSSPIKNIQRMGRTGRNRDGKVLLLFSSNEEQKFDKAMGGYEYIQNHIMNGNLINLHEQVRVIPKEITPVVDEQFIEIPDENLDIKAEEDEDEIIKIASNYMTGKTSKSKKGKTTKSSKTDKLQKRFFMPDDVDTGFKLVSMMLKKKIDNVSVKEKRRKVEEPRPKDILDSILDFDDDFMNDHNDECKTATRPEKLTSAVEKEAVSTSLKVNPVSPTKTLGLRRPGVDNVLRSSPRVLKLPAILYLPNQNRMTNSNLTTPTLGIKRRPMNVLDQLKAVQSIPPKEVAKSTDDFDADDDEILALARQSSSIDHSRSQGNELIVKSVLPSPLSELYPNIFSDDEGLLTKEENNELYMSYYVPAEAYSLLDCYKVNPLPKNTGKLRSGRKSQRFTACQEFIQNIGHAEASAMLNEYAKLLEQKQAPLSDFIDFS